MPLTQRRYPRVLNDSLFSHLHSSKLNDSRTFVLTMLQNNISRANTIILALIGKTEFCLSLTVRFRGLLYSVSQREFRKNTTAVSYTHLDVYKRQGRQTWQQYM